MPVLVRTDGNNRVVAYHPNPDKLDSNARKQWQDDPNALEVDTATWDELVEQPARNREPGTRAIRRANPSTGEVWVEFEDRLDDDPERIVQRLDELEKATGSGGRDPEKGISARLDDIEDRIATLESERS